MARTTCHHFKDSPGTSPDNFNNTALIETVRGQLVALQDQLEKICRVIHPTQKNFDAFGHDIRNLLILACTEVEAQWKGVLTANGAMGESTNDYVKLAQPMRLADFEVSFSYYPWLTAFKPFDGWSSSAPTKSLVWYDAYNKVKHDGEKEFEQATLQNAFQAICGCVVMMYAQFGQSGYKYRETLSAYFELTGKPKWHATEVYCPFDGVPAWPQAQG